METYFERVTDVSVKSKGIDLIVLNTSACQRFYFPFCLSNRESTGRALMVRFPAQLYGFTFSLFLTCHQCYPVV